MIDYGASYSANVRVYAVNPATWSDGAQVADVDSAKLSRKRGDLLESGTLTLSRVPGADFPLGYYRIVIVAEQDSMRERVEVATMLCASSGGEISRGVETLTAEGRSVLYPASVKKLLAGRYAPRGCDGASYAGDLLRECVVAPVSVEGTFTLGTDLVFDLGCSHLEAAWMLLDAGAFCMQIDGHGTIHVLPLPTMPALELDSHTARIVAPSALRSLDYSEVPNVYVADDGGIQVRAVNADPTSPVSTVSRGYEHDEVDKSPKPVNGESLASYAWRRLAEESTVGENFSYTREHWEGVLPYSVVRASLDDFGMAGDLRVDSQEVEIGRGLVYRENAIREVRLWTA